MKKYCNALYLVSDWTYSRSENTTIYPKDEKTLSSLARLQSYCGIDTMGTSNIIKIYFIYWTECTLCDKLL